MAKNIFEVISIVLFAVGFIVMLGAFGYDDYMMQSGSAVDISFTVKHALCGLGLMGFGIGQMNIIDRYF